MSKQHSSPWYTKWYIWVIIGVFLLVAFLPAIFSTPLGKELLLDILKKTTGQEIEAKNLSLSWFGPQRANQVVYKDKKRHITFTALHVDTAAPLWKLSSLNANLNVHEGQLKIEPPHFSPIIFQNIEIQLNAPQKNLPLIFTMSGTTEQQGIVGSFNIKGEISGLDKKHPQGNLQATIDKLPVRGVDQLLNFNGTLSEIIGSTIDLKITASTIRDEIAVNVDAASSQFTAQIATVSANNTLKLESPSSITLVVTPNLVRRFTFLDLYQEAKLTASIQQLSCDFTDQGLSYDKLRFNADVNLSPNCISGVYFESLNANISSLAIDQKIDVILNATSPQFTISTVNFSVDKNMTLTRPTSITYHLSNGSSLNVNLTSLKLPLPLNIHAMEAIADVEFSSIEVNNHFVVNTLEHIEFRSSGKNFNTFFTAKIQDDFLIIKKPFTINTVLTNQEVENHFPNASLAKPAEIKIDMQPLSIPLLDWSTKKLHCQGRAYTEELQLLSRGGGKQFVLKKPVAEFAIDSNNHIANLKMSSTVGAGNFALQMDLAQFTLENNADAIVSLNASVENLNPAFIDTLSTENLSLQTLLGKSLDLKFKLNSSKDKQIFSIAAKSQNINLSGKFLLQDNLLQLQNPGLELQFVVAKEAYPLIDRGPFQLQQPALCSLKIDEMNWPICLPKTLLKLSDRIPNFSFNWDLMRLKGELFLKEIEYQQFALNNTQFSFEKRENISFSLNSNVSPQGQIYVIGEMPSNSPSQIKMDAMIKDFPTIVLDLFSRLFGHPELSFLPIFGKTLNAQVKLDLDDFNGPVALNLASENTHASFAGKIEQGYFTLNESLYAQVLMTPELSALLLKQMNPLSIKEITSKSPITLEINSAGFLLPLQPFDPSKLFIGAGKLELGKISCRNEGNINTTLSILKWGKVGKGDILKLWFAPCVFSVKQGVASIERTEILIADSLDIALWGKLDLPQNYVDMTLGLTASALSTAFGIKNLPKDYVLQVPMYGPMKNVKVDTGSATTKIALLFAWQQKDLAGSLGGSAGSLFGGFINKVVPLPDMNSKAPPAKRPFPWEEPQKEKTKSRPIRKGDKPLKQLLKILR